MKVPSYLPGYLPLPIISCTSYCCTSYRSPIPSTAVPPTDDRIHPTAHPTYNNSSTRYTNILIIYMYDVYLAYFGEHSRYILPPLSPPQPAIANDNIICWGALLNFFAIFVYTSYHIFRTGHVHAAFGSVSSSMELMAFTNRQFAPKIVNLSVCFIRMLFFSSS